VGQGVWAPGPTDEVGASSPSQRRIMHRPPPSGARDMAAPSEAPMAQSVRICGTACCHLQFLAVCQLLRSVPCDGRPIFSRLPRSWVRTSETAAAVRRSALKDRKGELETGECDQGWREYGVWERNECAEQDSCGFNVKMRGLHVAK